MAQIASINVSTANSSPSSQVSNSPNTDSPEAEFLAMLTQASNTATNSTTTGSNGISTSNGSNAVASQFQDSFSNQLQTQVQQLLNSGVPLDKITNAIASKLVALSGQKPGPATNTKITAVADYLKSGESPTQDSTTTAKHIVAKIKALVSALAAPPTSATSAEGNDSGTILDASQAGENPTTPSTTTDYNGQAQPPATNASAGASQDQAAQTAAAATAEQTAQAQAATPAPDVFALAVQALQTATAPASTQHSQPASTTVSPAPNAASAIANATPDQTPIGPSPTQTTQNTPGQALTATQQIAAQTNAAAPASNSTVQPTLGQLAVQSSLQVATDLSAIASGQGTALGRALLRAANVDTTSGLTSIGSHVESTLASLTATLDDLFGAAGSSDGSGPKDSTTGQNGALNSTLADASLALQNAMPTTTQTSFASTLSSVQAPIDVDDIMDQIVHGVSIKNFIDSPTVKIALNPPNLGELSIKLTVTNSTVTATVLTQSSEVRSILLDNRAQLGDVLANAGLKLGSLNVDVSGQGLQQEADRRQAQRDQVFASSQPSSISSDSETPAVPTQSTGPSMLGGVDINLLNQLV